MRFVRTWALCVLAVGALALPAGAMAGPATTKVAQKINKVRAKRGLATLRVSPALSRSAKRYACRMLQRDYFGHASRVSAPSKFKTRGEILALTRGYRARWRIAWRGWMSSSSHRGAILRGVYRWVGVGKCKGRFGSRAATTWVVHFGRL